MASLTTTTHDENSELLSRLMAINLSLREQPLTPRLPEGVGDSARDRGGRLEKR